jgi:TonB family protein
MKPALSALVVLLAWCVTATANRYTWREVEAMFLYEPSPEYPVAEREANHTGSGLFRMYVDEDGKVTSVKILQTTRFAALDQSAVKALRQWEAVPGPRREVDIPMTFRIKRPANTPSPNQTMKPTATVVRFGEIFGND